MGQCQDVDIPRFVECLGSFQYLDATAQMAEMGSKTAEQQRALFQSFKPRYRCTKTCPSALSGSREERGLAAYGGEMSSAVIVNDHPL